MLHAHHMGRKWVLRACGRALSRAVSQRWEAGDMRLEPYDDPETGLPGDQGTNIGSSEFELGCDVCQDGEEIRGFMTTWKARRGSIPQKHTTLEDLVYFCNLAESMGFERIVGQLEKVGMGLVIWRSQYRYCKGCVQHFQAKRLLPHSDPDFFHTEKTIAGYIAEEVAAVLGVEVLTGLGLVSFLVELDVRRGCYAMKRTWEESMRR